MNIKSVYFFFGLCLVMTGLQLNGQYTVETVEGSWAGQLEAAGTRLRVIFHLQLDDQNQLSATLDSPDQGARGIGMGEVTFQADSLTIQAPAIMGKYEGKMTSDSTMEGTWSQAGQQFPLNLKRQDQPEVLNRPQEPQPPYPYKEEEVTFENTKQHFNLGGTLTLPDGKKPFPAIVLVSGSGSQNRDEEIFGHKPFKVIADDLTRNGIAVLRYDDRGVGASGGSAMGATSADNATDAQAAIDYLVSRKDIDPGRVGIIGHSEGGLIALMITSEMKDLACAVLLAGPGVSGKIILLDQSEHISRLSGIPEPVILQNRQIMERVYGWMEAQKSYPAWTDSVNSNLDQLVAGRIIQNIQESSYPWLRYFVMSDPAKYFKNIHCPVLALNGEKDSQVLAEENITAIRDGLEVAGNHKVTAVILPGLNHLFQPCDTGLPAEYGNIEWTFDQDALDLISSWLRDVLHA
ncbi:MAG: alpha/beta hydrolase family protein [Bacteroidales bacterium]